ncbi:hypothetical protein FACS18949_13510 [Clostridia bacterium]|nr:hypothetical protein FACS189425_06320 [Clostridia bacterium]GHV35469.1 hypothetical protein FACS18949_13510 [Clostridia bacterium]
MTAREYPDVNFVDTAVEPIVAEMVREFETLTGRTLYPSDPFRLAILWGAYHIVQNRVQINDAARNNVPRFARGRYLDSLGEIFHDVTRLSPTTAKTTLRFYITVAQPSAQTIPMGTRVSVDGEITFTTTQNLTIAAGALYGDISAECLIPGVIGNDFTQGQISQIIDIYPFYDKAENITVSTGGADEESDAAYYSRMRESMDTYSTAGSAAAYEYFAKKVSPLISDAKAVSPSGSVANIYVLLQNGVLPDEQMLQMVYEGLSADKVRPITDLVTVFAPSPVLFEIDLRYWVSTPNATSSQIIQNNVNAAVAEYIAWQTSKMGRDINPTDLIYAIKKAGAKRVTVTSPSDTVITNVQVAVLNAPPIIIYGGIEDE